MEGINTCRVDSPLCPFFPYTNGRVCGLPSVDVKEVQLCGCLAVKFLFHLY